VRHKVPLVSNIETQVSTEYHPTSRHTYHSNAKSNIIDLYSKPKTTNNLVGPDVGGDGWKWGGFWGRREMAFSQDVSLISTTEKFK